MALNGMLDKFTWFLGKIIGEDQADDIQNAVESAFKQVWNRAFVSGVFSHPTVAATSPVSGSISIGADSATTPDDYYVEWTTVQTVDVTYADAGAAGDTTPSAGQQKYVVVGVKHLVDDQQGAVDDNGALVYYKQAAQCEMESWASQEEVLGTDWVGSAVLSALLVSMRASNVEPIGLAIREPGDGGVVAAANIFDVSRWLHEKANHRTEHLDLRQAGAYSSFPVVRTADGLVAAAAVGTVVTITGGEYCWIGWNSRRFGSVIRQRAVQVPAYSVDFAGVGAGDWIIRMYLDEETGDPVVYYAARTETYPDDPTIGLGSHSSQGGSDAAHAPTLVDMPLAELTTDGAGVVTYWKRIENTAQSWVRAESGVSDLENRANSLSYPVEQLHKAVGVFYPNREYGDVAIAWVGGKSWLSLYGLKTYGAGGGAVTGNLWWDVCLAVDGGSSPILRDTVVSGIPEDDEQPLASFVGSGGAIQAYRDLGHWGHAPYLEGFDVRVERGTPSSLKINPGMYVRNGRVVALPYGLTITLTDAGLTNYRDENFTLSDTTWYYLYLVPLSTYRANGQGTAPAKGGLTAYPFLSEVMPDYSGQHPTWARSQFVAAMRCVTALTGEWLWMKKTGDFVSTEKVAAAPANPGNGVVDYSTLTSGVPVTARDGYLSVELVTTGAYAFGIGPFAVTDYSKHPLNWSWAALLTAGLVGPVRVQAYSGSLNFTVATTSNATAAALTSMAIKTHGYWERPLSPYHHLPL